MMGKPITGRSFGGCVRYVVNKQDAKVIAAEGVRIQDAGTITRDFNLQRKMRPELGKAVGHLVLSWSKEDLSKLSDQIMVERAKEYMDKVGICNTQFVVVRHHDSEHPHLHVIYNRVDNNGNTITDKNNFAKNVKACKEITLKYSYHIGEGKEQVNRQALKGKEKIRYELFDVIKAALKQSGDWKQLEANLQKQGIGIAYKYRSGSNDVQGISFEKGDIKMKGSAIDRSLSYVGINTQLNRNLQAQQEDIVRKVDSPSLAEQLRDAIKQHGEADEVHVQTGGKGILETLLEPQFVAGPPDPMGDADIAKRKRKKHEAEHSQSQRITR
ncbi:Relaxase/Mobilisation nuclease domain-containing protein [Mucilaginibacter gossypiicola]|uniref:Relaxase/Mobilisation nuclease domain-containing protein n=1 Tax=Mucilaginibacter gossypiicola TaxID=551995 RepID=A0A1H8AK89_9SPHI|nr:relaxase/mobilization nuclease domain-containing protein [Mucilaginibacter gossypiicola]SEM69947.1 Relaxase/Mobilisation nuclease domain-containing protein [Mucilaginibacter gossypiicola]